MTNRNLFSLACLILSDIDPDEDKQNVNASYTVNIYEYVGFFFLQSISSATSVIFVIVVQVLSALTQFFL